VHKFEDDMIACYRVMPFFTQYVSYLHIYRNKDERSCCCWQLGMTDALPPRAEAFGRPSAKPVTTQQRRIFISTVGNNINKTIV